MIPPRGRLAADATLLALSALWGATFVVVKDALDGTGAFSFLVLRFATGAILATAIAGRRLTEPHTLRAGLLLGVLLFAGYALQTTGLAFTTPSRSAFITGLMVLIVPLVSVALFRRWPRPATFAGIALAVAGLFVLTHAGVTEAAASTWLGDALTFGCAFAYALQITFNERFAPLSPPMALVAVQLWVVTALSVPGALLEGPRVTATPALWGAVLYCGLFASALAIGLQTWAQARTTAVRTVLLFSLEPVFATAYSVALGRETIDAWVVAGGTLMVAGVLVAELWPVRARAGAADRPPGTV